QGFDPALLPLSSHSVLPSLTSNASNYALLEGHSWYGTLDRRPAHLAAKPAVAFQSPDARHAYVIPDERVIAIRPVIRLSLPDGWKQVAHTDCASYAADGDPDRGLLELSLKRDYMRPVVESGQTLSGLLPKLAVDFEWQQQGNITAGSCAFGGWAGGAFSIVNPDDGRPEHVHAWLLGDGRDLLLVSW